MTRAPRSPRTLAAPPAERFDRLVRLAHRLFDVPVADLRLLGRDTRFARGSDAVELIPGTGMLDELAPDLLHGGEVEIEDARTDPRVAASSGVVGPPHLRFLAAVPLRAPAGQVVGALGIADVRARRLDPEARASLVDLAAVIERELVVHHDLVEAGLIQETLLPLDPPRSPGLDVAGRVIQARDAGGDFYDWQDIRAGAGGDGVDRLQVMVVDVMGKGLPAAMLAAGVRTALRAHSRFVGLAETLRRTDAGIQEDLRAAHSFATLWAGRVDPATGDLEYLDAGHGLAAIVSPRAGRSRWLAQALLPIGVESPDAWASDRDRLAEGEILVLMSDGVLDAFADLDALLTALTGMVGTDTTARRLVDRVVEVAADEARDDVTVLAVRRAPREATR